MIRPKWLAHATASPRRWLHESATSNASQFRTLRAALEHGEIKTPKRTAARPWKSNTKRSQRSPHLDPSRPGVSQTQAVVEPLFWKPFRPVAREMLQINGVSPCLRASDFHRLANKGLASWNDSITNVTQRRDPWTLEPLGTYQISFDTPATMHAFKDKLNRLHGLSRYKLSSTTGLWTSAVPEHWKREADLEEEERAFTLGTGSLSSFKTRVVPSKGDLAWQRIVANIITKSEYPASEAVVLVTLLHSCFTSADLMDFIEEDGRAQNYAWNISTPYRLSETLQADDVQLEPELKKERDRIKGDPAAVEQLKARFAIVCENEDVAWRFIRNWNQRMLTKGSQTQGEQRTLMNVSLIEL